MKEDKEPGKFLKYGSLGVQMVVLIGLSAWLGLKIDHYLQLKFPVFLLLLVFVSFGGMMYRLYRSLNE